MNIFFKLVVLIIILTNSLYAHEYWFEPLQFEIKVDENLMAHEKVGSHFKGNEYAYLSSSYKSFNISIDGQTQPINSRLGDLPVVNKLIKKEGLAILSAVTTPSELVYKTSEKFQTFLRNQGLEWVLERHKERGLPEKNFKEIYLRYPKSLIKVGHGKGQDKRFGLALELVLETNPYTDLSENPIRGKLFWKGKPLANKRVNIFNRLFKDQNKILEDSILTESYVITDPKGEFEIPQAKGGIFLLSAVQMIESSIDERKKTDAVWKSLWASTTYQLPHQIK